MAASGNKIEIKDIKTSAEIWISTSERIQRLKIAQNKIAALSRSGVLTLFNLEDGKSLRRIRDEQKIEKFLYNENLLITQSASCIKFCLVGPKGIECKSIIKKKDARKVKLFSNQFIVLSKDKVHIFRVSADV
ncbi:MAG: hypothetical protein HWD61_13655 [Parachlamydiaceae bacterium]|nr:MAG: hypothetical protein HWD61_13655 [Parachlamydiaceae bacterium]